MLKCLKFVVSSFFLTSLIFGLLSYGQANASLTLTPGVSLQVEYDDNLFLTNEDEVDDVSTTIVPKLSLLLGNSYFTSNFNDNDSDIESNSYTSNIVSINYSLEFRKYNSQKRYSVNV